jgi:hypothetical protein
MFRFSLLVVAVLILTACEGKKSLDGYPMDKPPPSAYAPRDSEPVFGAESAEDTDASKEAH